MQLTFPNPTMYENDRSQSPGDNMVQQDQSNRSVSRSRSRSPVRRSRSRSRSRSPRRDDRHRDRARRINLISKRIIISNIPYELKWQDIKDIFRKEVGDVTYVELFENSQGKSKGQGVIEFKDKDTARKAIENMHRYKIKDRNIVVREERESDRGTLGGRGVMGSGPSGGGMMGGGMMGNMGGGGVSPQIIAQLGIEGPITNQVFVSNLDYKVTWKKLKDVFKLAGNVTRAEIKEDKDGKSRGMGTVSFETQFEAVQAISMFNGQTLYDRQMRVKMDSLGAADKSPAMPLPSGLKSIGAGLGPGGTPLGNLSGGGGGGMGMGSGMGMGGGMNSMGGSGMGSMGMNMDSGMGMGNMGMSNMGSSMNSSGSMGMGMNSMGSGNYSSSMGMGNMGSSGMGMGSMSGMSDNYNSMSGSGLSSYSSGMGGGMGDTMRMGSSMGSSGMSSSAYSTGITDSFGSSGRSSSSYGVSSSSYSSSSGRDRDRDSSRGTRPDNCTVVVKNLPWKITWQDLKEKFRTVADVKFAEIKMENGKSQGWGLVRFGSAEDAQNAISMMNRTRIDGREVDVKLYR